MSNVNAAVNGSDGCEEQEEDEELGGHESQMADLWSLFNRVFVDAVVVDQQRHQRIKDLWEDHLDKSFVLHFTDLFSYR